MKILAKWLICIGALWLTSVLLPAGVRFQGGWLIIVAAGTILWLANLFLRPILHIISFPITLATLGLFSLIVNASVISLVDAIIPVMKIANFWYCILISLIISAGNAILTELD